MVARCKKSEEEKFQDQVDVGYFLCFMRVMLPKFAVVVLYNRPIYQYNPVCMPPAQEPCLQYLAPVVQYSASCGAIAMSPFCRIEPSAGFRKP